MAKKTKKNERLKVMKTYKLYVGGSYPRTESGRSYTFKTPKGDFVANLCQASRKDFRDAVLAARKALGGWSGRTAFNRGQILYRMAEMLEARRSSFEHVLVEHAGYKASEAEAEVDASIDRLVWYAGWADKYVQIFGSTNPVSSPHFNFTTPEPTGVVAIFSPTKAPLLGLISAIVPVMTAANTCVVVVDNNAPTVAIEFAEVLNNSDLPGGVVNLLTGFRDELRDHIGGHKDVEAVLCFGGDSDFRKALSIEGAESVKRVHYEDDLSAKEWRTDKGQSPYRMMPFIEFKTAWHPIEPRFGGGGGY
jgi:acyl-CoA reductase-like NAD-dependent aldehyde dehydrogenase